MLNRLSISKQRLFRWDARHATVKRLKRFFVPVPYSINRFSPPDVTTGSSAWVYEKFYLLWEDWFRVIDEKYGGNSHLFFKSTGSYSFDLTTKIRVIVVNTVYCSRNNFWNLYQPQDLGKQLSFLVSELRKAESRGQSAHIVGHNPPNSECTDSWLRNYIRIVGRFKSVITASFFGHTHSDQYYLYFGAANHSSHAYGTAFVGGSITTFGHVNPCYKVYTMDKDKVPFSLNDCQLPATTLSLA